MFSGESQGSTLMAVKLAHERNGAKIQIPLTNTTRKSSRQYSMKFDAKPRIEAKIGENSAF